MKQEEESLHSIRGKCFTVVLAMFQSIIFMIFMSKLPGAIMPGVNHGLFFISSIAVLTAGSMLVMWLSELITEKVSETAVL